jgi:hypothetical protein
MAVKLLVLAHKRLELKKLPLLGLAKKCLGLRAARRRGGERGVPEGILFLNQPGFGHSGSGQPVSNQSGFVQSGPAANNKGALEAPRAKKPLNALSLSREA